MGVFNKFKSIFRTAGEQEKEKPQQKSSVAAPEIIEEKPSLLASLLLKNPHVSEKATNLAKEKKYVFKVAPKANKVQIKKAIEELYGVEVSAVNIINTKPKARQLGRISGVVPGYKKAIVQLAEGQRLDILPQ